MNEPSVSGAAHVIADAEEIRAPHNMEAAYICGSGRIYTYTKSVCM